MLHVSVFDGRSDTVPNLPQTAFHVVEDGKPQEISFFSNQDLPVAVGLVIDNSSSMLMRRGIVLEGARAFANASHPQDETFSIIFNENVRLGLPETVPFTQNKVLLQATLDRFPAGGLTALHDAVIAGLDHLERATHQKRVLVVLSDGRDNASTRSAEEMLARAARSDALIYVVSTFYLESGIGDRRLLQRLADATGGATYLPKSKADVIEAFGEIAGNIRRGYSIGYVPTNTAHDGSYRRVAIRVAMPGRSNLRVQSREGYRALQHADGR